MAVKTIKFTSLEEASKAAFFASASGILLGCDISTTFRKLNLKERKILLKHKAGSGVVAALIPEYHVKVKK